MNLPVNQKHFLSFSRKLFLSVISLFLVFAICFIAYQYQREREYKVELLNTQLQDYNSRLYEQLNDSPAIEETTDKYIRDHALKDLRVTLIDLQGNVIYDSYKTQEIKHENHRDRPEVQTVPFLHAPKQTRKLHSNHAQPLFSLYVVRIVPFQLV